MIFDDRLEHETAVLLENVTHFDDYNSSVAAFLYVHRFWATAAAGHACAHAAVIAAALVQNPPVLNEPPAAPHTLGPEGGWSTGTAHADEPNVQIASAASDTTAKSHGLEADGSADPVTSEALCGGPRRRTGTATAAGPADRAEHAAARLGVRETRVHRSDPIASLAFGPSNLHVPRADCKKCRRKTFELM